MKHKTAKANVRTRTGLLSLLLAVLMTLFCFPVTALVNGETNGGNAYEAPDSVQNIGLSEQTNGLSELTDVSKIALNGMSEEDGEPVRLPLLEKDLYTIAYTDTSGKCKMKMFSYPVKYVDADGKIKDISLEIEQDENGGFRTAASNIITKFPQKLTDGISLEYDDIKIEMTPVESTDGKISTEKIGAFNAMLSADNKKVSYTFGSKTRLDYELTYTGFKEDIVVESYTGQTEYNFFIKTNGLTLTERSGSYFIEDSDGNVKATIGDIIIFTADERNNTFGSMTHTVIKENQIYAMTVHVDAEFLKDEKTAYPIRIDPTVEINYDNNGAGAIEDYTVNTVDTLSGSSGSICLGKYASDGSVSRILMRIPNFNFAQYTQNQIVNVSVNIRDLQPGTAEAVVSCYRFTGNAWSESSSVSWNGVNANAYSDLQDTKTVSYASGNAQPTTYWYSFNITNVAKQWAAGTADQSKGIIFKAADTTESGSAHVYKTFASYNRASYKPTVTVEYVLQVYPIEVDSRILELELGTGNIADRKKQMTTNKGDILSNFPDAELNYYSLDNNIATVDGNGEITGHNNGVTTVAISIFVPSEDKLYYGECTVYVYTFNLDADDYHIISYERENFLFAQFDNTIKLKEDVYGAAGAKVWSIQKVEGEETGKIHYIKIKESESSNTYYYLTISNDKLQLTTNFSSSDALKWKITYRPSSGLYYIRNVATSKGYDLNEDGDIVAETDMARCYLIKTDEYDNLNSFSINIPTWIPNESTVYTLSNLEFKINPPNCEEATFSQPNNFIWKSSDTRILNVDENGNFIITPISNSSGGYVAIKITHKSTGKFVVANIVLGQMIPNSTVYDLMNIESDRYAEIEGHTTNEGAYIQEAEYHGESNAKWYFTYAGDGYYKIRSVLANKYIAATSTAAGAAIIQTNVVSDLCLWKLMVTKTGNYKFVLKNTDNLVLSLPSLSESAGTNLVLKAYSDDALYTDEWLLQQKRDASFIVLSEVYYDNPFFDNVLDDWASTAYNNNVFADQVSMGHNILLNHMVNSKITAIMTHGNCLEVHTSHNKITTAMLAELPENALESSELIIYGSCEAGKEDNEMINIVEATYALGCDVVIGFPETVDHYEINVWFEKFFECLAAGMTVEEAKNNTEAYIVTEYPAHTTYDPQVLGDTTKRFVD